MTTKHSRIYPNCRDIILKSLIEEYNTQNILIQILRMRLPIIEAVTRYTWGTKWGNLDGGFNRSCDYSLTEKFCIVNN